MSEWLEARFQSFSKRGEIKSVEAPCSTKLSKPSVRVDGSKSSNGALSKSLSNRVDKTFFDKTFQLIINRLRHRLMNDEIVRRLDSAYEKR